ncbi:hypothetical protein Kpol_543p19 [Vanderwaltozyma polyspora DSM 70294]|uniref:Uncharacterized protein n=1 Tax=Vanderwaltozyma polyspora (strain ATCC 22028 / DSM 70294 / BCRC 21397 / CBS 2163 / NBRC 10782 / NRRL Y-8283 / UCD 57-17) TaxID=436907 RepID=A7THM4_VANPO|nr:uncharacterized protein Kpol_543p19 [Vanderwaltozyma polyspora DSM 70294]EDO18190.1 hypothetical protein Kpol_543p19 [Vanderwaltozyma polyspora DSM 70294]
MVELKSEDKIKYTINGPFFVIKLDNPKNLNAMTREDYLYLGQLLEKSENNPDVYFTVLTSTGRFFSSGADFANITAKNENSNDPELTKWLSNFVATNLYVTDMFARHSKVLICCLNGPSIGMSAAIVALCDIVYSKNDLVYLLFPFASLGLITEGATSVTLPRKINDNVAYEKLIFSQPFKYDVLKGNIIVKNYKIEDTDEFNSAVLKDLSEKIKYLHLPSCLGMKNLIHSSLRDEIIRVNSIEVNDALKFWLQGEPQRRFKQLLLKERSHKL